LLNTFKTVWNKTTQTLFLLLHLPPTAREEKS